MAPVAVPSAVTLTVMLHEAPGASATPDTEIRRLPGGAVAAGTQVPPNPFGEDTARPGGRLSEKEMPVIATPGSGLLSTNVRTADACGGILAALNIALNAGGSATVSDACAAFPAPAFEVTGSVTLAATPLAPAVTLTVMKHDAPAARDAPVRVIALLPGTAPSVPPQLFTTPAGCATARITGRGSVNPIPVSAATAFGFAIVNVSDTVPPTPVFPGENDIESTGGIAASTVSVAEEAAPGWPGIPAGPVDEMPLLTLV